jgi:aspartate racemase
MGNRIESQQRPRRLGILGGMGPMATADFFAKLTELTAVARDQDHIPAIIASIPQIPDRTEALLRGGPSPLPAMTEAVALLERAGVDQIVIPCNTAHAWFDELVARTEVPMLHIVDAVMQELQHQGIVPPARIGILGTTATIVSGLYQRRLEVAGYRHAVPNDEAQLGVMAAIRSIKASRTPDNAALLAVIEDLHRWGCSQIVLACTELPLVLSKKDGATLLDATQALASACVRGFGLEVSSE